MELSTPTTTTFSLVAPLPALLQPSSSFSLISVFSVLLAYCAFPTGCDKPAGQMVANPFLLLELSCYLELGSY